MTAPSLLSATRAGAARVLAFALPPRCPGCGAVTADDHAFCTDCWGALDFLGRPACATCGVPLPYDEGPDMRCDPCLAHPPALDGMCAATAYDAVPRRIALRLKHGRRPGLAETIARRLERLVDPGEPWLIAPVPLHRWRIWSRGYNQSALIGRALARRTGLPFSPDLIARTRHTPSLRGLGRHARLRTVRDAFAIPDPATVAGRAVLLIDDVFTTGATANACAAALKAAGAREVRLLCWARVALEPSGEDA
ncbi:ComF family protein [Sphingomonas solaris]|uniref:ComF family protein n=1 Tax=Alterirhizorhabdus solaris TaxID=2529389 RepID=A0A558R1S1_9SPHN|nr:double zinc ribbon domain-containing protein [Sphingomonas solaris]TVV73292.1 ComF family protein [Sphingomonas solaris]